MIIVISPSPIIQTAEQKNKLYNLIKRNEEDLARRFPMLDYFYLELVVHSGATFSSKGVSAVHMIKEDESRFTLRIDVLFVPTIERIYEFLLREIAIIKNSYLIE